jgi:chemotaxis protein CheD
VASSLAVCVRDRVKRILGMSHFMLPTIGLSRLDQQGLELAKTCGHAALAKLLHDIYSYGCEEDSLEAVLVSGGEMWPQKKQSTVDSLDFAREYLSAHGVEIIGEFLGGPFPKKIYFNLEDEVPYVRALYNYSETLKEREDSYLKSLRLEFLLGQRKTNMDFTS